MYSYSFSCALPLVLVRERLPPASASESRPVLVLIGSELIGTRAARRRYVHSTRVYNGTFTVGYSTVQYSCDRTWQSREELRTGTRQLAAQRRAMCCLFHVAFAFLSQNRPVGETHALRRPHLLRFESLCFEIIAQSQSLVSKSLRNTDTVQYCTVI